MAGRSSGFFVSPEPVPDIRIDRTFHRAQNERAEDEQQSDADQQKNVIVPLRGLEAVSDVQNRMLDDIKSKTDHRPRRSP